jgi:osmotically-inducible protein OsmY
MATSSVGSGASANASRYLRPYPVQLSFGQALYNTTTTGTATVTRGGLGTGTTGFGSTSGSLAASVTGASSVGMRRAPSYVTEVAFDQPAPIRTQTVLRTDLQGIIDRSSRLPSRDTISVSVDANGVVVLRGRVRDARERRLAESLVRLERGVSQVRNELRISGSRR